MQSKFVLLLASLTLAAGTWLAACSSGDTPGDEAPTEQPEYESLQQPDDAAVAEADTEGAEQPPMGQPEAGDMPRATGPVATVDGVEISADEFNEQLETLQHQLGDVPPQYVAQMQDQIVEQLIQQQLLYNAIDEADIEVTDEQIEARLEDLRAEFRETAAPGAEEDMEFDDFVAQMGMTPEELDEVVEETVAIEMLLEQSGMDMPTEEDVREFYDENPDQFTEPESVETRILVIGPPTGGMGMQQPGAEDAGEAEERAREMHRRATEEDETFEELAEDSDDVATRELPVARDQPHQPEELEDTAFDLEDSEISEPIETPQGWLIIQRMGYDEGGLVEFQEVEEQLERDLRNRAMEESLQEFLGQLEQDAQIERHPENIE